MLGIPEGEEGDKELEELKKEMKEKVFALASEINQTIAQAEKDSIDRRLANEKKHIDDKTNSEKKGAEARKNAGILTEAQYQKELERIDKKADAERLKAEKKAFEDKKRVDTKAAIIDTLLSVSRALATVPPGGQILAAFMAAEGAVRVATIQSQKFAKGGIVDMGTTADGVSMSMVNGRSHAQGGVRIYRDGSNEPIGEVEGGEILAVINKRSSRAIQRMSQLNQMGGGRKFAAGGVMYGKIPTPADIPNSSDYYSQLDQQRQREINTFRNETQELIKSINRRVTAFLIVGCTKTVYVPKEVIKTEYRDRVQFDSIYQRDSVFIAFKGDTVDKYIYRDKFIRDTVCRVDSISYPVIVEVVKQVKHIPKVYQWTFGFTMLVLGAAYGIWLAKKFI